jgi:hypothetical protein
MKLEFKKIKRITKINNNTDVINFTIEKNENYFANNILTHNCYMKRNHPGKNLNVAKNLTQITYEINCHAYFVADDEKPNQTDDKYITYDIG